MNKEQYLNMQRDHYEGEAAKWSPTKKDHVVGSYDAHNRWPDYDTLLFKDFDTNGLVALEYGCGPGRNLIRFANRFKRIDGVDIAMNNLIAAETNLRNNNVPLPTLIKNDGCTIPVLDDTYDVVFSVICLQHIACYDIRFSIFQEIHRVLKPRGKFCFQMGFRGHPIRFVTYYENSYAEKSTNGYCDVIVEDESQLKDDLVAKIGFKNFKFDIAGNGPGDDKQNWIWVQVEK